MFDIALLFYSQCIHSHRCLGHFSPSHLPSHNVTILFDRLANQLDWKHPSCSLLHEYAATGCLCKFQMSNQWVWLWGELLWCPKEIVPRHPTKTRTPYLAWWYLTAAENGQEWEAVQHMQPAWGMDPLWSYFLGWKYVVGYRKIQDNNNIIWLLQKECGFQIH